jgi:hypothetical protein
MADYLRYLTPFSYLKELYQQTTLDAQHSVVVNLGAKIFVAKPTSTAAPFYIVDTKKVLHSKRSEVALTQISGIELDNLFEISERNYILDLLEDPRIQSWEDFVQYTYQTEYSFNEATLSDFIDAETKTATVAWQQVIQNVLSYNAEKDPTLVLINKATLPRGFMMQYQPHTILLTNVSAGKTTFYKKVGLTLDKTTRVSLLGSIKGKEEQLAGLFDDQYYVICIEQLESQKIENLAGFALNFLEDGLATISGAGLKLLIRGAFPLVISGNPITLSQERETVFKDFLIYLGTNAYALGRRFGLLAVGNYSSVVDKGYDDIKHTEAIRLYRALEERAFNALTEFWLHPQVQAWCKAPAYTESDSPIYEKIKKCQTVEVRSFLFTHYNNSYQHLRGGALNCAIIDNLPLFVLHSLLGSPINELIPRVLQDADKYVPQLTSINKKSIEYILGNGR